MYKHAPFSQISLFDVCSVGRVWQWKLPCVPFSSCWLYLKVWALQRITLAMRFFAMKQISSHATTQNVHPNFWTENSDVCALQFGWHILMLSLFFFFFFSAKALKCHYCFSKGGELCEPTSIQTCAGSTDACGAVILQGIISESSFVDCPWKFLRGQKLYERCSHRNKIPKEESESFRCLSLAIVYGDPCW